MSASKSFEKHIRDFLWDRFDEWKSLLSLLGCGDHAVGSHGSRYM